MQSTENKMEILTVYDLCIVGAGMFGSAAARHASANAGIKVCLIGPEEPTLQQRSNREIFGAHYDEGRITRTLDPDVPLQILSRESMKRYRKLEELSGIKFYSPVGLLYIAKQNSSTIQTLLQSANTSNVPVVDLSYDDIFQKRFPYLRWQNSDHPLLDDSGAGHISPRNMVAAQKKVAKNQGCDILNKVVKEVKPLENGIHEIMTEDDQVVKAKRVLICTGAFTNLKKFPMPKLLTYNLRTTVALLKLSNEEAQRLGHMPSIIYKSDEGGAYILPPIKYPDGNYYIKIGPSSSEPVKLKTLDEVKAWYLSKGDPESIKKLEKFATDMVPGLKLEEVSGITCVIAYNPSGLPYIGRASPTVTVAAIANGKGAKFSDEVGRIAATLSVSGKWDSELPESNFRLMFEN